MDVQDPSTLLELPHSRNPPEADGADTDRRQRDVIFSSKSHVKAKGPGQFNGLIEGCTGDQRVVPIHCHDGKNAAAEGLTNERRSPLTSL